MSPLPLGIIAASGGVIPGFNLLQTTIVNGTTTSDVTFSNLSAYTDYSHLQLRMNLGGSSSVSPRLRFNGNTTSIYPHHELIGLGQGGNTMSSNGYTNRTFIQLGLIDSATYYPVIIDILNFKSTTRSKTARILQGYSSPGIQILSGFLNSTSALSSLSITLGSGTFANNSRISLYGVA